MDMMDFDVRYHPYLVGMRAKLLSSLFSEGHLWVGAMHTKKQLHDFLRHPNGNKTQVIITRTDYSIIVNGKQRKSEQLKSFFDEREAHHTCLTRHVKNPKPKAI